MNCPTRDVVQVYPRPRGGTGARRRRTAKIGGLSPPTRGNPVGGRRSAVGGRSIPAHAGEPVFARDSVHGHAVYPRPRGGTVIRARLAFVREGLSPPTRGNPSRRARESSSAGSIPAHAGEPHGDTSPAAPFRVYPRPRGGTLMTPSISRLADGLSPPTRGNRSTLWDRTVRIGSIPAHAGEPGESPLLHGVRAVYPRPRGGTSSITCGSAGKPGLSPPTRGNP